MSSSGTQTVVCASDELQCGGAALCLEAHDCDGITESQNMNNVRELEMHKKHSTLHFLLVFSCNTSAKCEEETHMHLLVLVG